MQELVPFNVNWIRKRSEELLSCVTTVAPELNGQLTLKGGIADNVAITSNTHSRDHQQHERSEILWYDLAALSLLFGRFYVRKSKRVEILQKVQTIQERSKYLQLSIGNHFLE